MTIVAAFDGGYFLEQLRPNRLLLEALWTTVYVSVVAQFIGTVIGATSGLMSISRLAPLRAIAGIYTWVFRGTPVVLQIFFWYFAPDRLFGVDVPRYLDLGLFEVHGAIVAGIIALALNEGAYMSELVRAAVLSVDEGQTEASLVVGMTEGQAMRRMVLPQAARLIVPGLGNEFNNMLKTSALISFIGVTELFQHGVIQISRTFLYAEIYLAIAVWYLLLTTIWMLIQVQVERRLGRSERRDDEPWHARIFGVGRRLRSYS